MFYFFLGRKSQRMPDSKHDKKKYKNVLKKLNNGLFEISDGRGPESVTR